MTDPYNLYSTPDGRYALVMAEALRRIDVRDAHTMKLVRSLPIPCAGINHADYTTDLATLLVSCEFSGKLAAVDATRDITMFNLNTVKTPGATDPAMARSMGGLCWAVSKLASSQWMVSWLWHICTNVAIRAARVSGFFASWTR